MQPSDSAAMEKSGDKKEGKKPRRRMKAIYVKIKEQMEFYFSDSNLHKDRFLKKTIEATEDRYVPLDVFLKFNKIKALTDDVTVIAYAVAYKSEMLQVNEDKTKVRRVNPLAEPKKLDERTVYVECLPSGVDHDWVRRTFSPCGKVAYVSMPRYRSTGDMKGFAFVEFDSVDGATAACETLNNPPTESADKVGMFPKSNKPMDAVKKKLTDEQLQDTEEKIKKELSPGENLTALPTDNVTISREPSDKGDASDNLSKTEAQTDIKAAIKRTRTASESSVGSATDGITPKRKKLEVSFDLPGNTNTEESEKITPGGSSKKKARKRKSRSRTADSIPSTGTESSKLDTSLENNVHNIPEKKRKVENVQEGKSDVTQSRNVTGQNGVSQSTNVSGQNEVSQSDSDVKDEGKHKTEKPGKKRRRRKKPHKQKLVPELRVIPKKQWLVLREEYLKLQKASMTMLKKTLGEVKDKTNTTDKSKTSVKNKDIQIEFVADVIISVLSETPITRKDLKTKLGEDIQIAYIDLKDGQLAGHIRCKDAVSAKKILAKDVDDYTFTPVSGEDEKSYWDKLMADRDATLNSKSRSKKRGHQKWTEKAQNASIETVERKHVVFDDAD